MADLSGKITLPSPDAALPGRTRAVTLSNRHFIHGRPLQPPFPGNTRQLLLGLGCFWGAERLFWSLEGVYTTAVGYAGGFTPNPSYEEVCSGLTGHTEVVLVVFEPDIVSPEHLLSIFWEAHDPTQGMRQGNDIGTQYRSAIYCQDEQLEALAVLSRDRYQQALTRAGKGSITTEIRCGVPLYYAEEYHQQYLGKNPNGYCGLKGTGVDCPLI